MGFEEEDTEARKRLETTLDELLEMTPDRLTRSDELGTQLGFAHGTPVFRRTLSLFRELREADLTGLPAQLIVKLQHSAQEAVNSFKAVLTFSPGAAGQTNPEQVRDQLITNISKQYVTHFEKIAPILSYTAGTRAAVARFESRTQSVIKQLEALYTENEERGTAILNEANETVAKVRQAAAEVGASQHAVHFMEEAGRQDKTRRRWLLITSSLGLATLGFGIFNVWYYVAHAPLLTTAQSIQLGAAKLVVFAVLYFAMIWAGRVYRAASHNYVVNQHRQNALSTFEAFLKAAGEDQQTKNAVLLQATQCIFAHQGSGFGGQESETQSSPQILEIIRSVVSGQKE